MSQSQNKCQKKIKKQRITNQDYVPGFLSKLYEIVSTPDNRDSIEFTSTGDAFVVKNEKLLAESILPTIFKHKNYSSFVRQLNMYGFKKIRNVDNQNEFRHKYFLQYERNALSKILRKNGPKQRELTQIKENTELMALSNSYDALKVELIEINKFNDMIGEVNQQFRESTLVFVVAQQQIQQEVMEMRSRSAQWHMISEVLAQMIIQRLPQGAQSRLLQIHNVEMLKQIYRQETKGNENNSSSNSNSDPSKEDFKTFGQKNTLTEDQRPHNTRSIGSAPEPQKVEQNQQPKVV